MRESQIWERNFHVVDDKQEEDKVEKKKNSRLAYTFRRNHVTKVSRSFIYSATFVIGGLA